MHARRKIDEGMTRSRVVLTPGNHASPRDGLCVVELASLLAGEAFSDRPRCVCPVIAAYLRAWNDRASYVERQRLQPYAARIVESRQGARATRERREICLENARNRLRRRGARFLLRGVGMRLRVAFYCGVAAAIRLDGGAGDYAARLAFADGDGIGAFELLEALLENLERQRARGGRASTGNGYGNGRSNGEPAIQPAVQPSRNGVGNKVAHTNGEPGANGGRPSGSGRANGGRANGGVADGGSPNGGGRVDEDGAAEQAPVGTASSSGRRVRTPAPRS